MRIGLVVERFEPLRGGLEQWSFRFAQRLTALGHEVHVVSRAFAARTAELPITAHQVCCRRSLLAFADAAQAVLVPLELDIVHDMGNGWYCDVFQPHGGSWTSVTQRKLERLPRWRRWMKARLDSLLSRHRTFSRLMARQYADRGQVLLAMSNAVAQDFQRYHHVAPERIRVVYNGVDPGHFAPDRCAEWREPVRRQLGIGPDTVLALVVAHNFQLKGVPTLLRAIARLVAEGRPVHLAVVGGKQLPRWRRRAERLGIGRAVSFLGPKDEPLPYYAAADLYVHPTLYDTCSLVVLEAAACGLPLITSRCNGASELLQDGVDALLLSDPTDSEELAGRVRTLLDGGLRRRLGDAARRVAMRCTFDRNVDEILGVYREIVNRRAGLPANYEVFSGRITVAGDRLPATPVEQRLRQVLREPGVLP